MRFVTKEQPTISNKLFTRAGVRYEVALDVLGAIIANYSEAIAAEHEKPTPDEAAIKTLQRAKSKLRTLRDELDPDAEETIEHVLEQYGPRACDLYVQ